MSATLAAGLAFVATAVILVPLMWRLIRSEQRKGDEARVLLGKSYEENQRLRTALAIQSGVNPSDADIDGMLAPDAESA